MQVALFEKDWNREDKYDYRRFNAVKERILFYLIDSSIFFPK